MVVAVTEVSMNKILRRLGLKDDYGYCDTSIVGFIVLWSLFGYGTYVAISEIIAKF